MFYHLDQSSFVWSRANYGKMFSGRRRWGSYFRFFSSVVTSTSSSRHGACVWRRSLSRLHVYIQLSPPTILSFFFPSVESFPSYKGSLIPLRFLPSQELPRSYKCKADINFSQEAVVTILCRAKIVSPIANSSSIFFSFFG